MSERWDAVVVGSGPNGLVAALRLAASGRSVLTLEAAPEPGGGLRSGELLEKGFRHDLCATVMALAPASPALAGYGFDLVAPPAALAHPLDDGTAVLVYRSLDKTAERLGADAQAYRRILEPLVKRAPTLFEEALAPIRIPRHPMLLARLEVPGVLPANIFARLAFRSQRSRAMFAGVAAHSILSLAEPLTAGYGLVMLVSAHASGWPFARGGSASIAEELVARLRELGGEIRCGSRVKSVADLPREAQVLLDLVPKGVLEVAADHLPDAYRAWLRRYRYGAGVFKLDWTLDAPIPWRAVECAQAGTVHLGGGADEIAQAEHQVAHGRHPERPFVILTQPTLFDPSRAPLGKHVAWAYCHVPNGSDVDMSAAIESQVERFAPGFRDIVRARKATAPLDVEREDPNCVGGDINGGRQDLAQLFIRPAPRWNPYTTPNPSLFLCSAATPPGGGVHGMCGWLAAAAVMRRFGAPPG